MHIPVIKGIIERRMLVNYSADPKAVQRILPAPFRPKLYSGSAIVGICLIRLRHIRPRGLPAWLGIGSENGAHRFAVEWDQNGETKSGVYIPRRDTSSYLNHWAGGRIFPGKHGLAQFDVHERDDYYHIAFRNPDGTSISVDADRTEIFDSNSVFKTLENASAFFEQGALGYTPGKSCYDGLTLKTYRWEVAPLKMQAVHSSFFEDTALFPSGSIRFDHALLMEQVEHEWQSAGTL